MHRIGGAVSLFVDAALVVKNAGRHHFLAAEAVLRGDAAELSEGLWRAGLPEVLP